MNKNEMTENKLITFKKMKHDTLLQILEAMKSGLETKREIQRYTGISWGTCSEGINLLEQRGLISTYSTNGNGQPGPRSSSYVFSREQFLILGIEVAVEGLTFTLTGLDGTVLCTKDFNIDQILDNNNAVTIIQNCIHKFISDFSLDEQSVYSLQFCLTGAVDQNNLIWIQSPKHYKIQSLNFNIFYSLFPHVHVINIVHDIQARATDIQYRLEMNSKTYVMIHISDGLGMAAKEKNTFIQGERGLAGEIGHIPYYGESLLPESECFCGQKNCIEHYLHYQKILDYYNTHSPKPVDYLILMDKNSSVYEELYQHVLRLLLYVTRILVNIFDCSQIVIGGKSLEPWQSRLEKDFLHFLQMSTWQKGPENIIWYNEQEVSPSHGVCLMNGWNVCSAILRKEINNIK